MNVADQKYTSSFKKNSASFLHSPSSCVHTPAINTATPRNNTSDCMTLDTICKAEFVNVSLTMSLSLSEVTAGTINLQDVLDTIVVLYFMLKYFTPRSLPYRNAMGLQIAWLPVSVETTILKIEAYVSVSSTCA